MARKQKVTETKTEAKVEAPKPITWEDIDFHTAINRIAAEFTNTDHRLDRDTGEYVEVNTYRWNQMRVLQSMANAIYADLYDSRTYKDSRNFSHPKGLKHRLDNAMRRLKADNAALSKGEEIPAQQLLRSANYVRNLEMQYQDLRLAYDSIVSAYETWLEEPFKPYKPWNDYRNVAPEKADTTDDQEQARAALAALGITMAESPVENQTDGINTDPNEVV